MRHGRAEWKDSAIQDFDRPLDRRGQNEIAEMGKRLREQELLPDVLLVSPAVRTKQSAEILARQLELPDRKIRRIESLYLASPDEILARLRELGPLVRHALLVGHNPGIAELAHRLAPEAATGEFVTGAACLLEFSGEWADFGSRAVASASTDSPRRFFDFWS